ncbi:MAG: hypothetical protein ABEK03_08795 [Candidatus Bipolaricaulia bacterium]
MEKRELSTALSFHEIREQYGDCWVLLEETAWDDHDQPTHGIVKAASETRSRISQAFRDERKDRQTRFSIFYAGEAIPDDLNVAL